MPPKAPAKKKSAPASAGSKPSKTINKSSAATASTGGDQGSTTINKSKCTVKSTAATANTGGDRVPKKTATKKSVAEKEAERKKKEEEKEAKKTEATRKKAEKEAAAAKKQAEKEAAAAKRKEVAEKKKAAKAKQQKKKKEEAAARKADAEKKKAQKEAEKEERKKAAVKKWQHSTARKMLIHDMKNGDVTIERFDPLTNPLGTTAEDAYKSRPEFQQYSFQKFEEYLEAARVLFEASKSRAVRDHDLVTEFLAIHPKRPKNHRGEPRWEGSAAEAKLKEQMDKGMHLTKKPLEIRADPSSNGVYKDFQHKTISDHISQEVRARKFQAYLHDKNEEKKKKLGKKSAK